MDNFWLTVLIVAISLVFLITILCGGPSVLLKKYAIWKDRMSARMFAKRFKLDYFYEGWGTKEEWERFRSYMQNRVPRYPADVKVEWIKESEFEGSVTRVGKFLSPMHEMLAKGTEYAHFAFTQPKDEGKRNEKLLVIQVAGGQKGYGWRLRNMGNHFVKRGYSVLCPIPVLGIYRGRESFLKKVGDGKKKKFENVPWSVTSGLAALHSMSQESRSQINFLVKNYGFKKVVMTGQSWGGTLSVNAGNFPCLPKELEGKVDMAIVPISANNFLYGRSYMRKLVTVSNKVDFESCPDQEIAKKIKEEGKSPLDLVFKLTEMTLYPEWCKQVPSNIKEATVVQYKYDVLIVPDWEKREVEEFCKGILKKNGRKNEDFKSVELPGGHFTAFVNVKKCLALKKVVEEQFLRL